MKYMSNTGVFHQWHYQEQNYYNSFITVKVTVVRIHIQEVKIHKNTLDRKFVSKIDLGSHTVLTIHFPDF